MKKTLIRILAVSVALVIVCLALAACGKTLSGEYTAELGDTGLIGTKTTYKFSGSKVTITNVTGAAGFEKETTFEGSYEIKDDKITFTFDDEGASAFNQTIPFEETEDGIKLGGIEYKKQ